MRFLKVEGAGNDYVLVDGFDQVVDDPGELSRRLSDRHTGVGSDGLLLLERAADDVVAQMRIFNADGSEGLMCGNGLRCVVRYLVESGRASGPEVDVGTASGRRRGRYAPDGSVELDMGVPDVSAGSVPILCEREGHGDGGLPVEHALPAGLSADPDAAFAVSVGNPHLVVRVPDPDAVDLPLHGRLLETSSRMPEGANVHFVRVLSDDALEARPWERGSGATRACGTGAVAVAEVSRRLGWTRAPRLTVRMPGGELGVRWDDVGHAWLSGPARLVYRGEWIGS